MYPNVAFCAIIGYILDVCGEVWSYTGSPLAKNLQKITVQKAAREINSFQEEKT